MPSSEASAAGKRLWLVIIAVGVYKEGPRYDLPGVPKDANRLDKVLRSHRYIPALVKSIRLDNKDATQAAILAALKEVAGGAWESDQVVIWFGGHGHEVFGGNSPMPDGMTRYMLPHDATWATAGTMGISTKDLADALSGLCASEVVLILDCCHGGGLTGVFWQDLRSIQQGYKSRYVMAAARPIQKALDADAEDRGSPFTQGLCDALEGKAVVHASGLISATAAFEHAEWCVAWQAAYHKHAQKAVADGSGSSIYLTRPGGHEIPQDPKKYLSVLREETRYIKIRGLVASAREAYQFPIEDLFISLTTLLPEPGPGGAPRRRQGKQGKPGLADDSGGPIEELHRQWSIPLHEALVHRKLVVVGDPGSGKTTFLRRVAQALCETLLGHDPSAAKDRVGLADNPFPLWVEVPRLAKHIRNASERRLSGAPLSGDDSPAWLWHYLGTTSSEEGHGLDQDFFRRRLEDGGCIVLLDGLDNAPTQPARKALAKLIERSANAYGRCRFVLTSRPAAYIGDAVLPGFVRVQIDDLPRAEIARFLARWYEAHSPDSPQEAKKLCQEILAVLDQRSEIRRMARNPVMLTALAVVHWNQKRLPEERAELYKAVLHWLSVAREEQPGRLPPKQCLELFGQLALAMQNDARGCQVQVSQRWAAERIANYLEGKSAKERMERAEGFLDEEQTDSGIIVERGGELQFWHRTFQEYLAARAIAGSGRRNQPKLLWEPPGKLYRSEWREVVLLLGGVLREDAAEQLEDFIGDMLDKLGGQPPLADQARCAGLLGAMLRDLWPFPYVLRDPDCQQRYKHLLDTVLAIFDPARSKDIPLEVRIEAADALGQAGDPRIDAASPDYWVPIAGGKFLMGAQAQDPGKPNHDPEAHEDEAPVHEVHLYPFRIARYPVTVGEYCRFVDGGYDAARWWTAGGFGTCKEPEGWQDQVAFPNRPVVGVSWFEAMAYCAWAGLRLPSEAEWERAARGAEARKFPWGQAPADPSRLNYQMQVGHPTPVGLFPLGTTPDGIADLAGNVWEWCADQYAPYQEPPREDPQGPESGESRVLRGGSWCSVAWNCRAAYRNWYGPAHRSDDVGFRVAAPVAPRIP
jgi:formylglycine-generating enzyme required for sulfatase activity